MTREVPAFGVLLKRYRLAAGLTHEGLAERGAGDTAAGVAQAEAGARRRRAGARRRPVVRRLAV